MKQFITFLMLMLALTLAPMSAVADKTAKTEPNVERYNVSDAQGQLAFGKSYYEVDGRPVGANGNYYDATGEHPNWSMKSWPKTNNAADATKHVVTYIHFPACSTSAKIQLTTTGAVTFVVKVYCMEDPSTEISSKTVNISTGTDQWITVMDTKTFSQKAWYKFDIQCTSGAANVGEFKYWQFSNSLSEPAYTADYMSSPSVHLNGWHTTDPTVPSAGRYDWTYQEVMIPEGDDIVGTYCMSLGVLHGYMGIQKDSETDYPIIFSMWDNGSTDNDPNLPDYLRSGALDAGEGVTIARFGGEGTGAQAKFRTSKNWEPGKWVKFLCNARPEIVDVEVDDPDHPGQKKTITYSNTLTSAWVWADGIDTDWRYIATIRQSGANNYMDGWYSFLEDYNWPSGQWKRNAYYRRGGLHSMVTGKWYNANNVGFGHTDGGNTYGDRDDYGHGKTIVDGEEAFYLTSGGYHENVTDTENTLTLINDFEGKIGAPISQTTLTNLLARVDQAIKKEQESKLAEDFENSRETLAASGFTVVNVNSEANNEGTNNTKAAAIDGDESTYWHSRWSGGTGSYNYPFSIDIQLSEEMQAKEIEQIAFVFRTGNKSYVPKKLQLQYSANNSTWTSYSEVYNIADAATSTVNLTTKVTGKKYLRLYFAEGYSDCLAIKEIYFRTAVGRDALNAQVQAILDKENRFDGYSTSDLAALKTAFNSGNWTDAQVIKAALSSLASTGTLLKYGVANGTNALSSFKAYQLHNAFGLGDLIVKTTPAVAADNDVDVTDLNNNWQLLRSEKWNAYYLYNSGAQKYLAFNNGTATLTDKPTPVYVGTRSHNEKVNDKNVTVFDGFTFQFDPADANSFLTAPAASASVRGMNKVAPANTSAVTLGASNTDGAVWQLRDNYGVTPSAVSVNELLENVEENGLQPWTRPLFGGTVWTWNKTTNKFEATGKESTATPNRENNHGPVYTFPAGVGTVTTAVSNTDTSDQGGFRILGSGDNVTTSLGRWAGSIEVATGAVATVEYSNQLKGTEPTSAATVWVDGTLTFGGNRTTLDINDGNAQRWFIGENGKIISNFTGINPTNNANRTWNLQIIVADEAPVAGKTLVQKEVTRQVMTWGADMYSNINSCTIYHKDSDGYYHETTASDVTITHNATDLSVTYTAWVNEDVAPEPEDEGIKMSTDTEKYYYTIRNYRVSSDYAHYDSNSTHLQLNSTKNPNAVFYFTAATGGNDTYQAVNIHNFTTNGTMNGWNSWGTGTAKTWYISQATQADGTTFNISEAANKNNCWNHQAGGVKSYSADNGSAWYIEEVPTTELTVAVQGLTEQGGVSYNGTTYGNGQKFTAFFDTPVLEAAYVEGKAGTVTIYKGTAYVDYEEADPFFSANSEHPVYHKIVFKNGGGNVAIDDALNSSSHIITASRTNATTWAFIGTIDNFVLCSQNGKYVKIADERLAETETASEATTFKIVVNKEGGYYGITPSSGGNGFNCWSGIATAHEIGFYGVNDNGSQLLFYDADGTVQQDPRPVAEEYAISGVTSFTKPNKHTLWYTQPSGNSYANWQEYSLPIGNGELGGSVFGGVKMDKITLNEKSLWDGASVTRGNGPHGEYLKFGSVWVKNLSTAFDENGVSNYVRYLDIDDAVAGVKYTDNDGTEYTRTFISSQPDGVMAVKYTASGTNKLHLNFTLEPGGQMVGCSTVDPVVDYTNGKATFNGKLELLSYAAQVRVVPTGGTIVNDYRGITVEGASEIMLYFAGGTDFNAWNQDGGFVNGRAAQLPDDMDDIIDRAAAKSWETLLSAHKDDYHKYYNRANFDLKSNGTSVNSDKNTKELIDTYSKNQNNFKDSGEGLFLEQLYYNYGRYLLISSNRNKPVPNNLQGLWVDTDSGHAPWNSDIHTNINIQMNYWPAEPNNLSDLHMPLLNHIISIADAPGTKAQAQKVGQSVGWVINTESNLFGGMSDFKSNYTIANAWYVTHLWQHYRYTLDDAFLAKAFPAMKGAALYWAARLVQNSTDGLYECPNEWSPEHGPGSENATAHSQQLVRELFDNFLEASTALDAVSSGLITQSEIDDIKNKRAHLDLGLRTEEYQHSFVGSDGKQKNWNTLIADGTPILREWKTSSYQAGENQHRHTSHLMALYPFNQLNEDVTVGSTTYTSQQLFDAAVASLRQRSDESTGWAMGWRVNLWARAQDGNHARTMLKNALVHTGGGSGYSYSGCVYYNLFDAHAPFQIDGNFGVCAGISEMLLQSGTGVISLLPALPNEWAEGSITGLKAVGNFTVNQEWADKKLTKATIVNKHTAAQDLYVKYQAVGADSDFDLTAVKVTVNGVETTPVLVEGKGYKLSNVASEAKVEIIFNEEPEPDKVYTYTIRNKQNGKYAYYDASTVNEGNTIVALTGEQANAGEFTLTPVNNREDYYIMSCNSKYVKALNFNDANFNIAFVDNESDATAMHVVYVTTVGNVDYYNIIPDGGSRSWNSRGTVNSITTVGQWNAGNNDGSLWQFTSTSTEEITLTYTFTNSTIGDGTTTITLPEGSFYPQGLPYGVSLASGSSLPKGIAKTGGSFTNAYTISDSYPFKYSQSADNATWFTLKIRNTYDVGYQASSPNYPTVEGGTPANFAFIGTPWGTKIVCQEGGTDKALGGTVTNNGTISAVDISNGQSFIFENNSNHFVFRADGHATAYVNAIDDSSKLGYWDYSAAATDAGSTFIFTEVSEEIYDALLEKLNDVLIGVSYAHLIGYPTEDAVMEIIEEKYGNYETFAGIFIEGLDATTYPTALATYNAILACTDIYLPEDGKAYYFTNVQQKSTAEKVMEGKEYILKFNTSTKELTTEEYIQDMTITDQHYFICHHLGEGKYIFVNNYGYYLRHYANSHGGALSDSYDEDNDYIKVVKHATSGNTQPGIDAFFGLVALKGNRPNVSANASIVVNGYTGGFDASGDDFLVRYNADNNQFSTAFRIEEAEYTYNQPTLVKADNGYYASIYLPFAMQMPEGVECYRGVKDRGDNLALAQVNSDSNNPVPAGGYVLYSNQEYIDMDNQPLAKASVLVTPAAAVPTEVDNIFTGSTADGDKGKMWEDELEGNNPYVLANKSKGIGFYKYTGTAYPKGKAIWLGNGSSAECVSMSFDDIVEAIKAAKAEENNDIVFDLQGRRLQKAQKGINLTERKKVLAK